jgi:hypothetical protein
LLSLIPSTCSLTQSLNSSFSPPISCICSFNQYPYSFLLSSINNSNN